jgi:hypothetical protein
VLRVDNGYANLDCDVLSLKRYSEKARTYLVEAVGEVQDEWLPRIGNAAIAYLEEKLQRLERDA